MNLVKVPYKKPGKRFGQHIARTLRNHGAAVITEFPTRGSLQFLEKRYLKLIQFIGIPSDHKDQASPVWRVTPQKTDGRMPTFSELAMEAPYHSDSSFSENPEDYVALLMVHKADTGGDSLVFSVEKILSELAKTPEGRRCIEALSTHALPFKVPEAFLGAGSPVVWKKIFEGDNIRYRFDCIKAGLKSYPEVSAEVLWALNYFEIFLKTSQEPTQLTLEAGDILVVDNKKFLHARTGFSDLKRLALRVRFNLQGWLV